MKDMDYKKSYESRKYGKPSKAGGRSNGPLTAAPDSLKARKLPGHIAKKEMVPYTRGHC